MSPSPVRSRRPAQRPAHKPVRRRFFAAAWLNAHRDCLADSGHRLLATPMATLMTVTVVAIALLLPALLRMVGTNLSPIDQDFLDRTQITLYLHNKVTDSQGEQVSNHLLTMDGVETVQFLTRAEALEDFARYSGFSDLPGQLDDNPLPATILVVPRDKSVPGTRALHQQLQILPEVELAQLDLDWLQRLDALRNLLVRINFVLSGLLSLAVLFIVGNTIRLAIENRRTEIGVVMLVGGTRGFAARPFLYTGSLLGLAGGLLAGLLGVLVGVSIGAPLETLLDYYESGFELQGMGTREVILLAGIGFSLGWLGAWLSTLQQLRQLGEE